LKSISLIGKKIFIKKLVKVYVLDFIRDEKKFTSLIKLEEQIKLDKKTCLKLIDEK
jgi:FAD synthase